MVSSNRPTPEAERFFEGALDLLCIAGFDGYFKQLNAAWEQTLGYSTEELTSRPFIEFVHPDDRESTLAEADKLSQGVDTIAFENRYRCKDGSYRWLEWRVRSSAEDRQLLAVARDITAQKVLRDELILLHQLTRTIAEADDLDSALRKVLTAVSVSAGWSVAEAWLPSDDHTVLVPAPAWYAGRPGLEEFREESERQRFTIGQGLVGGAWETGVPVWSRDVPHDETFTRTAAARKSGLGAGVAIPVLAANEVVAVLAFFLDEARDRDQALVDLVSGVAAQLGQLFRRREAEAELSNMVDRFRELSLVDELTGISNRRGFLAVADEEMKLARRMGEELTLLFVDIDSMKEINDTQGHAGGDAALRAVAAALQQTLRESDLVARIGGDEFAVLLWGGPEAEREVRTRLRARLHAQGAGAAVAPSVSVGSTRIDPSGSASLGEHMAAADHSMYEHKRAGLSRVGTAEPERPPQS